MRSLIALSALMTLTFASAAVAGTSEDVAKCRVAIGEDAGENFDASTLKFKSVKGSSLKKITFDHGDTGAQKPVVCHIKRGTVKGVDWQ